MHMYHLIHRYYDPSSGIFISRDPLLRDYRYAYGNPQNLVDPLGLIPVEAHVMVNNVLFRFRGNIPGDIQSETNPNLWDALVSGVLIGTCDCPDPKIGETLVSADISVYNARAINGAKDTSGLQAILRGRNLRVWALGCNCLYCCSGGVYVTRNAKSVKAKSFAQGSATYNHAGEKHASPEG